MILAILVIILMSFNAGFCLLVVIARRVLYVPFLINCFRINKTWIILLVYIKMKLGNIIKMEYLLQLIYMPIKRV